MTGQTVWVTGATRGLGRVIAEHFLLEGARVVFCGRGAQDVAAAEHDLRLLGCGQVAGVVADLEDGEGVCRFAGEARRHFGDPRVLVNNAGILGPVGPALTVDWDEWERTVRINLYGVVRMCREVVPGMVKAGAGRVINLSGGGATSPMPRFSAYAASKAAVVRFTETLAVEVEGTGVTVNAVAPGLLKTRMTGQMVGAGPEAAGAGYLEGVELALQKGGTPPELAARLCVFLASPSADGITGKLISAPWDPWEEFPKHREDLQGTDVYCLRRITPKDRGMGWDPKANL